MSDVIKYPLSAAIELCEQLDNDETNYRLKMLEYKRERDEAREKAERYRIEANAMMMQRDEARENLNEEMRFHHRTHSELIQTQCKLLDMEMKCDQLQDEIKRLKVILDLIKKDTI